MSQKLAIFCSRFANFTLQKLFIPVIPLFILGFILKLQYDGVLVSLFCNYAFIFMAIFITQFTYIVFLYGVSSYFNIKQWVKYIKTMLPAGITGFTTMSSAATLPVTLLATEKNTESVHIPRLVVPITVNVHLIGDCIAIPILGLAIMRSFNLGLPDLHTYFIFACYFVLAKFAVAAVPGGGIIVMAPILERQLGFNSEMISLITALYIMLDPITTSVNVMGNGSFSIIMRNIFVRFGSYTDRT
jgi:Na+/H+-dicarboxylate symporter